MAVGGKWPGLESKRPSWRRGPLSPSWESGKRVWGKEWHKPRLGGDRAWPAGLREVCGPGPRSSRTLWRPCRGHLREPWKVAEQIRVSAEAGKAGGPSGSLGGSDLGCSHEGSGWGAWGDLRGHPCPLEKGAVKCANERTQRPGTGVVWSQGSHGCVTSGQSLNPSEHEEPTVTCMAGLQSGTPTVSSSKWHQ